MGDRFRGDPGLTLSFDILNNPDTTVEIDPLTVCLTCGDIARDNSIEIDARLVMFDEDDDDSTAESGMEIKHILSISAPIPVSKESSCKA